MRSRPSPSPASCSCRAALDPEPAGQRRGHAAGAGGRSRRHVGRRPLPGRGRRRQRRGQPAHRRSVPACVRRRGARAGRGRVTGTMNNVVIGGRTDLAGADVPWVYYETVGGGQGGRARTSRYERRAHRDDEHANTPVEALERAPLRFGTPCDTAVVARAWRRAATASITRSSSSPTRPCRSSPNAAPRARGDSAAANRVPAAPTRGRARRRPGGAAR